MFSSHICAFVLARRDYSALALQKYVCIEGYIHFCSLPATIAHFQKEWKPGARVGALSIMGSFGDARAFVFNFVRTPNDPIIQSARLLSPQVSTLFDSGL